MNKNLKVLALKYRPKIFKDLIGQEIIAETIKHKIKYLTLYAFSTENWLTSDEEVEFLMFFNRDILIRRREEFHEKGVRFNFIGDLKDKRIPEENKKLMKETEYITKDNKKLNLVFAFNYGSHKEIHNAVHKTAFGHYFYLKLNAWLFTKKHSSF